MVVARRATLIALAFAAAAALPAQAQNRSSFLDMPQAAAFIRPTVHAQVQCSAIARQTLGEVSLIKAEHQAAAGELPAYCRITGYLRPSIRFEVALPDLWNRRLYMFGNGGYAGEDLSEASRLETRNAALSRGFMTVQQNTGHDASTYRLGDFADGNTDLLIDYASRAVHVTVNLAKDLAAFYYSRSPAYSYWDGCSTGGRQGLMAAQRYPHDFDGIVAGAPVLDFTNTQLWGIWNAQALEKTPISKAQLPVLAKAVMNKCDAVDGLKDGLITDPRQCNFDPAADLPTGDGPESFTPDQIETLKTIAGGIKFGDKNIFPGVPWGVEGIAPEEDSGWDLWIVSEEGPSRQLLYGETFLKNMAMLPKSGRDLDWRTFDIEKNYDDIRMIRDILDATDPDMSEFASRGGRIIGYFGWADPALNPMMGVQYYENVRRTMGEQATSNFYRLFMAPGMFHCRGGYGPDRFDAFTSLVDWVEQGKAPERIVASQMADGKAVRSRPLCPYPQVAAYDGGDVNDAASFSCSEPRSQ